MPSLPRRLVVPLLASCLALTACKRRGEESAGPGDRTAVTPAGKKVVLPAPLAVDAAPRVGVHVRDPLAAIATLRSLLPGVPAESAVAETILATQVPAELAQKLAPMIADRRPWLGAELAGEDILHLPLRAEDTASAAALLGALPAEGEFGAVRLPDAAIHLRDPDRGLAEERGGAEPTRPQRLAWVDVERNALTIAGSLAGVVTGRQLTGSYGKDDLWLVIEGDRIREYGVEFPYRRITARGAGLHDLRIDVEADPQRGLPQVPDLLPGTLANLHGGDFLALAASARWAGYQDAVKQIIREMNRNLDQAGFAAKMILDSLVQQASAVLRMWNGRVFVGIGPAGHLAIAAGAEEPLRAGQGLVRLVGAVIDNLELARMFTSNVPKLGLRRHSKDPEIHVLTVHGARGMLPTPARGLVDEKGGLRVAFGFSANSGAVYGMIGPKAETELAAWAAAIAAAPPASEGGGAGDLLALTVALAPEQIAEVLGQGLAAEQIIQSGLGLGAGRAPTQITIRQESDRYVIESRGPAPDVPPARKGREGGR